MDLTRPLTRRSFARLAGAASLAVVPMGRNAAPARAARSWCKADPGLMIGGREAHINLYSYEEMLAAATGPVKLVVTVPVGKEGRTELLYMDAGFGHGYELVVKKSAQLKDCSSGIDVTVEAYAPATDGLLPVQVELVPVSADKNPATAKGTANQWIAVKGKV